MTVLIGEIVTEVVGAGRDGAAAAAPGAAPAGDATSAAATRGEDHDAMVETVVRRATERVLAHLRQEWDR